MKRFPGKTVVFWAFPVVALLLAAMGAGGIGPWFYYSLVAVGVGALAAGVGPPVFDALARSFARRKSLLWGSLAGWIVIAGGLLILNLVSERRVTWAVYPALGLAMWPLGVWLHTSDAERRQDR